MTLRRFMAVARVDDVERTVSLADALVAPGDKGRPVCLLQCGSPSPEAAELSKQLVKLGRRPFSLVVRDRTHAQSDGVLARMAGASAVWVFADDLFVAFFRLFATNLAFALRTNARDGLPVIGVGNGALAMGGLLLAHRICGQANFDLVSGLGWGQRILIDGGANRSERDESILHTSVASLPGLLGVDLGVGGGIRVEGGRIESIGKEPIVLVGGGDSDGSLLMVGLEPGQVANIAPPPFAPFERTMLSQQTLRMLAAARRPERVSSPVALRRAPPPSELLETHDDGAERAGGRMCPMCNRYHPDNVHGDAEAETDVEAEAEAEAEVEAEAAVLSPIFTDELALVRRRS